MNHIMKKIAFNEISDYSKVHNIAVCTDKNVVRAMGVLLFSILQNNPSRFAFHIFFRGKLDSENKIKIQYLSEKFHVPIVIYFMKDEMLYDLHKTENISITTYYRLLMPYVLEEEGVTKVLYLDVDMLCKGNIEELFSIDMQKNVACVVKGFTSIPEWWKRYCAFLGMRGNRYFNAGMMLINIPIYIRQDIGNKAIQLASERNYKYMDQDVLNILLEDKVICDTASQYNCTMSVRNHEFDENKVKIVHFTGSKKPWKLYTTLWDSNYCFGDKEHSWKYSYYEQWRTCAGQSPWKNVPYDKPKSYTEWRYLSDMYRHAGEYKKACNAYVKYLLYKLKSR